MRLTEAHRGISEKEENMKTYTIINEIVRIGIEVYNTETNDLSFTRYCDADKIIETVSEIQRNPYNRVNRTFLADNYGREFEGKQILGIATSERR